MREQVGQRRCADLGLMLHQLIEAVAAGGDSDYGKEIGTGRFNVAGRVAYYADRCAAAGEFPRLVCRLAHQFRSGWESDR